MMKNILILFAGFMVVNVNAQDYFADLQAATSYLAEHKQEGIVINTTYTFLHNDSAVTDAGTCIKYKYKDVYFTKANKNYTLKTKNKIINTNAHDKIIYVIKPDNDFYKREKTEPYAPEQNMLPVDTNGMAKMSDSIKRAMAKIVVFAGEQNGIKKYVVKSSWFQKGPYDSTLYYFTTKGALRELVYYTNKSLNNDMGNVKVSMKYEYGKVPMNKACLKEQYFIVYDKKTKTYQPAEQFKGYKIIYINEHA